MLLTTLREFKARYEKEAQKLPALEFPCELYPFLLTELQLLNASDFPKKMVRGQVIKVLGVHIIWQ